MKQFAFIILMLLCSCWSNVFSQNNGNSLQHLYGDWQCDCLPMLSIGENCCSTVWNGVPISSTDMLFENDTLHVLFLLTTHKNKATYMEINIHATANDASCLIEVYEVTDFYVYTQSINRNISIPCKLSRDERQVS